MARVRTLKPEFFTDADLCEMQPLARLVFAGLWCHADREGRLEDKPRELKVKILPFDACDMDALLADLATAGFIARYEVAGRRYIEIPRFSEHQRFHRDEKPHGHPAPSVTATGTLSAAGVTQRSASDMKVSPTASSPVSVSLSVSDNGVTALGGAGSCETEIVTVPDLQLRREAFRQPPSPAVQAHADGPALCDRMDSVFRQQRGADYAKGRNDEIALGNLVKHGDAEVLRRWGIALAWRGYPSCNTWIELAKNWNAYAKAQDSPGSKSTGDRARI